MGTADVASALGLRPGALDAELGVADLGMLRVSWPGVGAFMKLAGDTCGNLAPSATASGEGTVKPAAAANSARMLACSAVNEAAVNGISPGMPWPPWLLPSTDPGTPEPEGLLATPQLAPEPELAPRPEPEAEPKPEAKSDPEPEPKPEVNSGLGAFVKKGSPWVA